MVGQAPHTYQQNKNLLTGKPMVVKLLPTNKAALRKAACNSAAVGNLL
jgi:hypothetical protein